MNKISLYYLLLFSMFFTSCITNLDDDMNFTPRLVLCCRLVPQMDTTILYLSHSVPIFSKAAKEITVVSNAIVEISDDNKRWVRMEYAPERKYYFISQTQFAIVEGKTYYVKASAPGYEEVSASCTVPYFRETNLCYVLKEVGPDTHRDDEFDFPHTHHCLEWTDYFGEENYYTFFEKFLWEELMDENGEIIPPFYNYSRVIDMDEHTSIFSDKDYDGKKMSILISMSWSFQQRKQWSYDITMIQMDKHTYLFETTSRADKSSMDDFLSALMLEPYQIYSNINNGFGLFGAFVMREYSF